MHTLTIQEVSTLVIMVQKYPWIRTFIDSKELKVNSHRRMFESDMNITFQTLAKHYMNATDPKLHVGLFDIEVDFDPRKDLHQRSI